MKQQTYIIVLEDTAGHTVNFERFNYKRLNTCIKKIIEMYKYYKHFSFGKEDLNKANKIIAYKTEYETSEDNKVLEIDITDFLKMIA